MNTLQDETRGGFSFDNCNRNAAMAAFGVDGPRVKKTGTTIAGIVYNVSALLRCCRLSPPAIASVICLCDCLFQMTPARGGVRQTSALVRTLALYNFCFDGHFARVYYLPSRYHLSL
jgi:hypothetical protein